MPQLATILAPLNELLHKQPEWQWKTSKTGFLGGQAGFSFIPSISSLLTIARNRDILRCIPVRIGTVLSHRWPDSTEHPVAFTSRSLNGTERKYSQLDKVGLEIIFRISKFRKYVLGRGFAIWTDHIYRCWGRAVQWHPAGFNNGDWN